MPIRRPSAPVLDGSPVSLGTEATARIEIPAGIYTAPLDLRFLPGGTLHRVSAFPWRGTVRRSQLEVLSVGSSDFPAEALLPGTPVYMVDEPFQSIELPNALNGETWLYSTFPWPPTGPTRVEHVVDAAAAHSPDYWDCIYEDGFVAGSSPGRTVLESRAAWNGGAGFPYYYGSLHFRISANWDYHPSDNKLFYWGITDAAGIPGHQYIGFRGDREITFITQYPGQPARRMPQEPGESYSNSVLVQPATYHQLEWLAGGNTGGLANGSLRVWLDRTLSFEFFNVRWSPTGNGTFFGANVDSVWGGTELPTQNGEQRLRHSHLRITCSTG